MTGNGSACSMRRMQVVHVMRIVERSSGSGFNLNEEEAEKWHARGYAVAPRPKNDGLAHPYNEPCPHCRVDVAEDQVES